MGGSSGLQGRCALSHRRTCSAVQCMLRAITTRWRVPRRFDETVFVLDTHAAGRIITHGLLACPEAGTQHRPYRLLPLVNAAIHNCPPMQVHVRRHTWTRLTDANACTHTTLRAINYTQPAVSLSAAARSLSNNQSASLYRSIYTGINKPNHKLNVSLFLCQHFLRFYHTAGK